MIEKIVLSNVRFVLQGVVKRLGRITLLSGPVGSGKTTLAEALYLSAVCSGVRGTFLCDGLLPGVSGAMEVMAPAERDFLGRTPIGFLRARQGLPPTWTGNPVEECQGGVIAVSIGDLFGSEQAPWSAFRLVLPGEPFTREDLTRVSAIGFINPPALDDSMIPRVFGEHSSVLTTENAETTPVAFFYSWDPAFCVPRRTADDAELAERISAWSTVGKIPARNAAAFIDRSFRRLPKSFVDSATRIPGWTKRVRQAASAILPGMRANDELYAATVSDGERYVLDVVSVFEAMTERIGDEEGLIVLEKPEGRLDPAALIRLLRYIASVIRAVPVQVIIETNSLEAIAAFARMLQSGEIDEEDGVFVALSLKNGAMSSFRFDGVNLEVWLESGQDARFVLNDDEEVVREAVHFRLAGGRFD